MVSAFQDVRYAVRSLRKSPGFTTVAVLTLALGVGANTAVFSLINSVLLRPLPFEQPDRLVLVWESAPFFGLQDSPVAMANYFDWRSRSRSFEEMGALEDRPYRLLGQGSPEIVQGGMVSASLLRALRTRPVLGRIFEDREDQPGGPKVAIISNRFWLRKFDADPNVVGKNIRLDQDTYTIVGVLAPGAEAPAEYRAEVGDIWIPIGGAYSQKGLDDRGRHDWMVVARLRPGVTLAQANAEMRTIGEALAREFPKTNEKVGAFVAPMREHFVSSSRRVLLILAGTVAFVLLIACSNVANLLLSRAANRTKEVAVRAALGASAGQLVRQFLCEGLLLCLLGAIAGVLLASTTFEFLGRLAPGTVTGLNAVRLDWRVLAFTTGIAAAIGIVFGLAPLAQVRRLNLSESLKGTARTVSGARDSRRVRAVLIGTEVALAFVLLTGAGLMIRTFSNLRAVDTGFRTENVLTLQLPGAGMHREEPEMIAFQREILGRIRALPGVVSAGVTNHIPVAVKGDINEVRPEDRPANEEFSVRFRVAGPDYFKTMGIPVLRGRDVLETDLPEAPAAVLVNQTMANTIWPGQDPIGRGLMMFGNRVRAMVVGVVSDIRQAGPDQAPAPEFYVPAYQASRGATSVAIYTKTDAAGLAGAVRKAVWAVDPDQPVTDIATIDQILDKEVLQRRRQTIVLGAFSAIALLLAAIGVYGVLSYLVAREIPEIGIRMALGASPAEVLRKVVGRGIRIAAAGVVVGILGSLMLSRFVASLLFGVKPVDPVTYAVAAAVLLLTAAAASYIPARRAMRVDPIAALRQE